MKEALILLASILAAVQAQDELVVQVEQGLLRGANATSVTGFTFVEFRGIPYAEAPVGDRRFQRAVNKTPWDGVRDALVDASKCLQLCGNASCGLEDCLYLNVYTPQLPDAGTGLRKVMVYIHGGSFIEGDGSKETLGPDFIVEKGVVLVTIQYRLNIFGFLSLQNELLPGNNGLKDQNMALAWVQRNIAAFGGDPNEVTLFGESAGGASVHYQVLSPLSKGLFKQAIAQSGSALNPWTFSPTPRERAFALGAALGLQTQDENALLAFLRTADGHELVSHMYEAASQEDRRRLFLFVFTPCVEPDLPGAFLTEEPAVLVTEGRYNHIPFMTGICSAEANDFTTAGGVLSTEPQLAVLDRDFAIIVSPDLRLPTEEQRVNASKAIKEFYFADRPITYAESANVADLFTDLYFAEGVDAVVRSNSIFSNASLYYYRFSFKGSISNNQDVPGVAHGDDVRFLFKYSWLPDVDPNSPEALTRERMVTMWTNFAIYGNPIPTISDTLKTLWPQYTENESLYLDIGNDLVPATGLYKKREDFWHSIIP